MTGILALVMCKYCTYLTKYLSLVWHSFLNLSVLAYVFFIVHEFTGQVFSGVGYICLHIVVVKNGHLYWHVCLEVDVSYSTDDTVISVLVLITTADRHEISNVHYRTGHGFGVCMDHLIVYITQLILVLEQGERVCVG